MSGIRRDHLERYIWAVGLLQQMGPRRVLDFGAGVGYGAQMMADAGFDVTALERDPGAVQHGIQFFPHPGVAWRCCDFAGFDLGGFDAVVAFEAIEHSRDALPALRTIGAGIVIGSVPNELVVPYDPVKSNREHWRHYTPDQIEGAMLSIGYRIQFMGGQVGKHGDDAVVVTGDHIARCRTLCFMAWPA